ncbi:ribosomal protein S18-alanine N-acetyltransferase [Thalassotalea mangrovi]|uniref:[Ribosomal protein bS18]-alanine N-acetyltransferase n=1 Tax=Thalassotalea mangrovi TaxID=2572245 RepID=A0A4U1B3R3_9GAMM|nr:ribosomal protein S18-alanine N-acetyltransferase [Thalassotalea mangrovi]TKB44527.1 ribosomal-protein-alanine N-acetyltransferase [Thalassotalea mangrovi]
MSCIKPFTNNDIDAIYQIETACNPSPWSLKTLQGCFGPRYITRGIRENDLWCGFYVADYVLDELTLMEIAVHPHWQRKGFASALLDDLFDQAGQRKIRQCFLEVRDSNTAAQLLYIKYGFEQIDRRLGYYPCNNGHEDAIIMRKTLPALALAET